MPLTTLVTDATEDLHALDPGREIRRGTLTFQPRNGDEPADLEFVEGPLPDVTLKGDGSRLRQVVTNIVGNIHRYTPADSPVEISVGVMPASISPESLARMSANDASMRYFIEAVDVSRSMQMGMNYAVVRFSDHGRACRELPLQDLRAVLHRGPVPGASQRRHRAWHGHRAVGGQGAQGLHLRDRLPGRRPHAHGGAAHSAAGAEDRRGRTPQNAKAERKAECNKAKQEKQQARQHRAK